MKFTDLFIRRPILSIVVSMLIFLVGFRALTGMPVRQFPFITSTTINVRTVYPGAPAELIQGFITTPIERALSGMEGIDYVTSSSNQSVSTVQAYVKLNRDPGEAMTDALTKIQQIRSQLPADAQDPIVTKSGDGSNVMVLSFRSTQISRPALSDHINRVVLPIIGRVPGVAGADSIASGTFAMRLWLDPARMAARGLTAEDVSDALRTNNVQAAPGRTKSYFTTSVITTNTGLVDAEQFRDMVVKVVNGVPVRMREIADVELASQDTLNESTSDRQTSVVLSISPTPDGNPLEIARGIRAIEPEINRTMPPGSYMVIVVDNSVYIQKSINEVVKTMGEAVVVVMVVIFLFLGTARALLIPMIAVPLSLVGVAIIAAPLGFSLNLLTLLAMVLAIGLVVDDAIVVVENISRHIEEGMSPLQAALRGAREIIGPIIAMTITLAAVYAPIGFLSGLTGVLFREFAFTLSGAVIISGIVALVLSPMMCSVFLKPVQELSGVSRVANRTFERIKNFYVRTLRVALYYKPAMAIFAVGILISSGFMFMHSKAELAPVEDQGFLSFRFRGPEFANLDYMRAYGAKINDILEKNKERSHWGVNIGGEPPNIGFSAIPLIDWNQRERTTMEIQQDLQRQFNRLDGISGFVVQNSPLPSGNRSAGPPFQVVIGGQGSYEEVFNATDRILQAARASGLFLATDMTLNFNTPLVHVDIDHAKANELGVSMSSISRTLATMVGENYVNFFNMQGRSYQVIPQVPRSMRLSGELLTQFYVRTSKGEMIPLSTVAKVSNGVQPNALTRFNQMNSSTFQASLAPGVSMSDAVEFLQREAAQLPQGFATEFLGEARQYVQEGNQLMITFVFALIVIFLVLSALYESMRDALAIMVSVPMSICGALVPLFFGLTTLNIYTEIGLVTLIGLISKHGILMVAFAREVQISENLDRAAAIERAATIRLRPILMTTLAMVGGLLPLTFAFGAGAASRTALGIVVVFGMSIGTVFTLYVLPVVYTWVGTDHRATAKSARRTEVLAPSPAE